MVGLRDFLIQKFAEEPNVISRVDDLYLPILNWTKTLLKPERVTIIGVNGPQGSGKSTLCETLVESLRLLAIDAATLSIDDFYLTREEQILLAKKNASNPYLQQRGYPGTHDVKLGIETLSKIRNLYRSEKVLCPQYNKCAFDGQGDRFPKEKWREIVGPIQLFFLEGWMLGYTPVEENSLTDPSLVQINEFLRAYACWDDQLDAFIHLCPRDYKSVIQWRCEAEEKRKKSGQNGMTASETLAYVEKFLPAYNTYLPHMKPNVSNRFPQHFTVDIGFNRLP